MEDQTNPFSEYYQGDVLDEEKEGSDKFENNDYDEIDDEAIPKISADAVAEYLLQKKLVLTALEFHMELLESGHELTRLRNYFSNPGNFVQQGVGCASNLHRSSSIGTFDSLDMTHSDDGGQVDDRVAVLEFELRQANDTIKSLRKSLTGAIDEDSFLKVNIYEKLSDAEERGIGNSMDDLGCNPLVKRAMNYLVNEYLLQNGHKLSSITLAEEIDDQDFEDWDDVGLNMSKPPNLLKLFQDYSIRDLQSISLCDAEVQTEDQLSEIMELFKECQAEKEKMKNENVELNCKIASVTKELEDSKGVSILSLLPVNNAESATEKVYASSTVSQKTEKCVFPAIWDELYSYWDGTNTWLFQETSKVASNTDELVSSLTSLLPKIIFCIDYDNRDKLIPILLSTAAMQNDSGMRYTLLHNLFNLIEKPDKNQRQVILSGCVAYAKIVGPIQAEGDVLPQFWEQLGHKFPERRLLVAEACGAIAPMLRPDMRSSLLLSILRQMEQEEDNERVRVGIVKSLAIVISVLEDKDKYPQLLSLSEALAGDPVLAVHQAACSYMLPVFASWAMHAGKFNDNLLDKFISNLETILNVSGKDNDHCNNSITPAFLRAVENLHSLLPIMLCSILLSMPAVEDGFKLEENDLPLVKFHDKTYHLDWVLQNEEQYHRLYGWFKHHISTRNVNCSPSLAAFLYNVIPRLVKIAERLDVKNTECINVTCVLFASMVRLGGVTFAELYFTTHQFNLPLSNQSTDLNKGAQHETHPLVSALLPVYLSGVLAAVHTLKPSEKLFNFMQDTLLVLSNSYLTIDGLKVSFVELVKKDNVFHEIILDVLKSGVENESKYVRAASGELLAVMAVPEVDLNLLERKVLVPLLLLSEDGEEMVQISTLQAFGNLLQCFDGRNDIIDKIISLFGSFLAPSDTSVSHHAMNVRMIKLLSEVTPKADPKFCNEFVLPHLAAITAKNNQESNKTKRSDLALEMLNTFTNLSFCFIPESLLQSAFVPGLRCLQRDIEKLHPECVVRVEKLIKDMEAKLDSKMSSESNPANGNAKSKFYKFF